MLEKTGTAISPTGRRIALLLVVVLAVLLVPLPRASRAIHALYDLGHAPLFGVLSVLLFLWGRPRLPRNDIVAALLVWLFASAMGVAVEYAQSFLGRNASWRDAAANMFGAAAFLMWAVSWKWKSRRLRIPACVIGIACLAAAWMAPAREMADTILQHRDMPLLASFERRMEFSRWIWPEENSKIGQSTSWATDGSHSMAVNFQPAKYPSVSLYWPVEDWSPYQSLTFDIMLTGDEPLPLVVKIEDVDHNGEVNDRYHARIILKPGLNSPRIRLAEVAIAPHGRTMDLRRIKRVQFFTVNLEKPRVLFLDNVRLRP